MIKVLHVLDSYSFGGAENLIVELALFNPAEMKIDVASIAREGDRDAMLERLRDVGLTPRHLGVRKILDPAGFLSLVRALKASDADVVHTHMETSTILATVAARIAGKPTVATLHHFPEKLSNRDAVKERLSVAIASRLGQLVLVSQPAFDAFADRYRRARSWRMVHNAVDVSRYQPAPEGGIRHSLWADRPPGQVWAVVAALRPPKGHLDLLDAWRIVVDTYPDSLLVVIGDGPEARSIARGVVERGLDSNVTMLGARDDVATLLQQVDGVVSASWTEALPTALIEAAASALPVIATSAGGTPDVVLNGDTGYVVPLRDVTGLAQRLIECMQDPEGARAMGAAGREWVVKEYSMATWSSRLLQLYQYALKA